MSGQQGNPHLQPGNQPPTYQQFPGQRPATAYLPQPSQARPAVGQQAQRPQHGWLGGVPAVYSGLVGRPQQASDGRLSDLLTGQAGRPMYPAMSQGVSHATSGAVSQPYQQLPVAALQTGYAPRPAYPAASQAQQQPARGHAPPPQHQAYSMYRPPASGAQAVSYAMPTPQQGYQPPPGSHAIARPGMQPRPMSVQTSAGPNFYQMLRPGMPGYRPPTTAAIAQQYSALLSNLRPQLQAQGYAPVPQLSEEDRKVLPKKSLKRKAVAAAGDDSADMDSAVETALVQVADDFITSAVASASGLARRRKSTKLEAADVAMYLERTWQLRVPGFAGAQVKPYRRPTPKERHQTRTAAIRKETTAASEASEKAQAAADAKQADATANQ